MSEIDKVIATICIMKAAHSHIRKSDAEWEALELSETALREQQQREKGCRYCDIAKCNGNVRPVDKATMMGLSLKFCPMCGKKLEGKA